MKSKKVKKILIALDFHPTSHKVVETGLKMAKALGAKVVLLHVKVQLVNYALTYKKLGLLKLENLDEQTLAADNFLNNAKDKLELNQIQTIVKEGDFAVSVLEAAKELAIDIIVMGSHSTRWIEEIVLGRITNKILQKSNISLLIIPTRSQDKLNTYISLEA